MTNKPVEWPKPLPRNHVCSDTYASGFNEAIDLCLAAHIAVLEGLKYQENSEYCKNEKGAVQGFNARIQQAIEKAKGW